LAFHAAVGRTHDRSRAYVALRRQSYAYIELSMRVEWLVSIVVSCFTQESESPFDRTQDDPELETRFHFPFDLSVVHVFILPAGKGRNKLVKA
jgi:hypothetical protein